MEKQILDLLVEMNERLKRVEETDLLAEMNERLKRVEETDLLLDEMNERLKRVEENDLMVEMNERLIRVEETVNRIETSQTEDVVGLLKVNKKKTDFEVDYLNNRLTEMDKRLFHLEKRIEN